MTEAETIGTTIIAPVSTEDERPEPQAEWRNESVPAPTTESSLNQSANSTKDTLPEPLVGRRDDSVPTTESTLNQSANSIKGKLPGRLVERRNESVPAIESRLNESARVDQILLRERVGVQGLLIDALSWEQAIHRVESWADNRESRVVSICNAHSVITAKHDAVFKTAVHQSDMTTADGTPVAWTMRRLGYPNQQRINGPDFMMLYCEKAAITGQKILFYGNKPSTLTRLTNRLRQRLPGLQMVGAISPPFRKLSEQEDRDVVKQINESGAQVVFVSLGCPKQEKWMAAHQGKVQAVMIGVGAAFDYHAGIMQRAPRWMQNNGLEWFYRLISEPGRLWRRYLTTNSAFVLGAVQQLIFKQEKPKQQTD